MKKITPIFIVFLLGTMSYAYTLEENIDGCKQKIMPACYNVGVMYGNEDSIKDEVAQNYNKAFPYFIEACKGGHGKACFNVGLSYNNGLGVQRNYKEAIKYYNRSIREANYNKAFANLGLMYQKGQGVKKNIPYALELYSKGCKLESSASCSNFIKLNARGY